jgi:hypothetical protein
VQNKQCLLPLTEIKHLSLRCLTTDEGPLKRGIKGVLTTPKDTLTSPDAENVDSDRETVKRGRGRPRKNKTVDSTSTDTIKRGRGRPRKNETVVSAGTDTALPKKESAAAAAAEAAEAVLEINKEKVPSLEKAAASVALEIEKVPSLEKATDEEEEASVAFEKVPSLEKATDEEEAAAAVSVASAAAAAAAAAAASVPTKAAAAATETDHPETLASKKNVNSTEVSTRGCSNESKGPINLLRETLGMTVYGLDDSDDINLIEQKLNIIQSVIENTSKHLNNFKGIKVDSKGTFAAKDGFMSSFSIIKHSCLERKGKFVCSNSLKLYLNNGNLALEFPDTDNIHLLREHVNDLVLFLKSLDNAKGYTNEGKSNELDFIIDAFGLNIDCSKEKPVKLPYTVKQYSWLFNVILLLFYYNLVKVINKIPCVEENDDLITDLNVLKSNLLNQIDPLVRHNFRKSGITVTLNTVVGYDSEYCILNEAKNLNKMLSAQLVLNNRIIVKAPLYVPFTMGSMHTLTSDIYTYETEVFINKRLESNINNVLVYIKELELNPYIEVLDSITRGLKSVKSVTTVHQDHKQCVNYVFPLSENISKFILLGDEGYSFDRLMKDVTAMVNPLICDQMKGVRNLVHPDWANYDKHLKRILEQRMSRVFRVFNGGKMSITFVKKIYLCCHLTTADLSVLNDFDDLKEHLDIVHKVYVTRGKGLSMYNTEINIRDTSLLAPAGKKSLASLGTLYEDEYHKISLPAVYRGNMKKLLEEDPKLFQEYAMRDSEITLKHANEMELFNYTVCKLGVPLTLSSIGKEYVLNNWRERGYSYQISPKLKIGDTSNGMTPKGLNILQSAGLYLPLYIGNYKGGRNESFMYG